MSKIEKDEFLPDGTKLCNLSRPYGLIYSDGMQDARYEQDGRMYRADRKPVGYAPKAEQRKSA